MPIEWNVVLGILGGGVVGYLFSRLFYANNSYTLGANRPLMFVFGAVLGVVVMTLAFRGGQAAKAEELTTVEEFDTKVVQSDKPVLVDFYATWCGPCKRLAPILDELEVEYAGKVKFYRVDVDKARPLANRHGIRGVPTLVLYLNGQEADRIVGGRSKEVLIQYLDAVLGG